MHDKYSLVHKDLKPQNIIVKPETSEVFIIDFGSAGGEGKTLKKYGTQSYFAPEIKDDEDSDSAIFTYKTDLYATGLILEEIIALINTVCPRMRKAREFLYLVETSENLKQVNPDKRIIDIKKIKEETDQISLQNLNITNDQPKEPEYKKLSLPR